MLEILNPELLHREHCTRFCNNGMGRWKLEGPIPSGSQRRPQLFRRAVRCPRVPFRASRSTPSFPLSGSSSSRTASQRAPSTYMPWTAIPIGHLTALRKSSLSQRPLQIISKCSIIDSNQVFSFGWQCTFISCGTQKQAVTTSDKGPLVQTKFYGVEFGDSRTRVYNHMHRYQLTKSNDGSYTIFSRDFGGYNWHFIEIFAVFQPPPGGKLGILGVFVGFEGRKKDG